jgi:Tol biopolymer transport system component
MRADGSQPAEFVQGGLAASWSPDGLRLAYLTETGDPGRPYALHLVDWDGAGEITLPIDFALDPDPSPRWSPDSRRLAVEGSAEGVYVIEVDTGGITSVATDIATSWGPVWSPDGARLAFHAPLDAALNNQYRVYTVAPNGADLTRIEADTLNDFVQQWSPDGSRLLVKSGGLAGPQQIYLLSLDGAERTRLFGDQTYTHPLAYSPNGQQLAFLASEVHFDAQGNITGSTEWMTVAEAGGANPRVLEQLELGFGEPGMSVPQWSPNGRYLAYLRGTASGTPDLIVADVCSGALATVASGVFERPSWKPGPALEAAAAVVAVPAVTATPAGTAVVAVPRDHARQLAWSPDGQRLLANTIAGVRVYDLASGAETALVPACCSLAAASAEYLASLADGGTGVSVHFWPEGDLVFEQRDAPAESFQSAAISPDGTLLATGERFQVRLWNLPTGELRATFQTADLSDSYVTAVGFTADSRTLVSVTQWEGRVHLWNVSTLGLRRSFRIPTVTKFVLSPGTQRLLADYATPGFELWDVTTGARLGRHPLIIGAGGPEYTAVSPNDRRVAVWGYTTDQGNMLAVWDLTTDTLLLEISAGPAGGYTWRSAAFSPDGSTLAVADTAGTIYFYETANWTEFGRIVVPDGP